MFDRNYLYARHDVLCQPDNLRAIPPCGFFVESDFAAHQIAELPDDEEAVDPAAAPGLPPPGSVGEAALGAGEDGAGALLYMPTTADPLLSRRWGSPLLRRPCPRARSPAPALTATVAAAAAGGRRPSAPAAAPLAATATPAAAAAATPAAAAAGAAKTAEPTAATEGSLPAAAARAMAARATGLWTAACVSSSCSAAGAGRGSGAAGQGAGPKG